MYYLFSGHSEVHFKLYIRVTTDEVTRPYSAISDPHWGCLGLGLRLVVASAKFPWFACGHSAKLSHRLPLYFQQHF